jgi:Na+/phosphate symporter
MTWIIIYFILSGTIGAYYMALWDTRNNKENITLFHILGNIFPALICFVPIALIYLSSKVIIKKQIK